MADKSLFPGCNVFPGLSVCLRSWGCSVDNAEENSLDANVIGGIYHVFSQLQILKYVTSWEGIF